MKIYTVVGVLIGLLIGYAGGSIIDRPAGFRQLDDRLIVYCRGILAVRAGVPATEREKLRKDRARNPVLDVRYRIVEAIAAVKTTEEASH